MGWDTSSRPGGEPLEFISRNFTLRERTRDEAPRLDCSRQGPHLGQGPRQLMMARLWAVHVPGQGGALC